VQTLGARYVDGQISLADAARAGCSACGSPGGGCQFLGTAASAQVVGEALGMTLPHSALAPSGQPIWLDMARRSAKALWRLQQRGMTMRDVLSQASLHNAMVVHAACGGSTNLLLHLPAVAHAAGLPRPTVHDWTQINRRVGRFVDCLPNGPVNHPTVQVFLAGGVPEIMLHLRQMGLLELDAMTVAGVPLRETLAWWETSSRRSRLQRWLSQQDGVNPLDVIIPPDEARRRGMTSTVCFPVGNLCPEGSVVKATSIDPSVIDRDGVYRKTGPARVFWTERDAIAAIKGQTERPLRPGDILVLAGRGPLGAGMEEIYQVTAALKYLAWGREVAVLTDARFSGVSTGACIGHVGPEALAGGPIGKVQDGDRIRIVIDRRQLTGSVDLVGTGDQEWDADQAAQVLASRPLPEQLRPDSQLPEDTSLWAILQAASGGTWGGCVYDAPRIAQLIRAGQAAQAREP
jgi:putative YjhG/YagF family dehydratase